MQKAHKIRDVAKETHALVHMLNDFIEIFKPAICRLIVEIISHRHQNVIRVVNRCLLNTTIIWFHICKAWNIMPIDQSVLESSLARF